MPKAPKPSPPCGRVGCMFHRFEPCVCDVMMRRAFALIIARNYEPMEYVELRALSNGMG